MTKEALLMRLTTRAARRRLARAVPVVGSAVAALQAANTIRRKGWVRGAADVALDLTPYVGRVKAIYELCRGELIPPVGA